MTKIPKDIPTEIGQRVIRRGQKSSLGTVIKIEENWVWVRWDYEKSGPKINHSFELMQATT